MTCITEVGRKPDFFSGLHIPPLNNKLLKKKKTPQLFSYFLQDFFSNILHLFSCFESVRKLEKVLKKVRNHFSLGFLLLEIGDICII